MSTTTDILDTTIPEPAWVLDPTYDSELNPDLTHSRASAARMVSDKGKYVSRASGVERVQYGLDGDPGLLVEAASRTNHASYSSAINTTNWSSGNVASESAVNSIIDGQNAYKLTGNGTNTGFVLKNTGTFSGGSETATFIIEEANTGKVHLVVKNTTAASEVFRVQYEGSNGSITNQIGTVNFAKKRRIVTGPNGNRLVEVIVGYDGGNSENVSGDNREIAIEFDRNANGKSLILHHVQIEEATNASSPIVTGSSAVTRAGDDYTIQKDDWWNPNEGTFLFRFIPVLYSQPFDARQFGYLDSNGKFTSYFNIHWKNNPAPFEIQVQHNSFSTSNQTQAPGGAPAFEQSTFATSFSSSGELVVSLNGKSNIRLNQNATNALLEKKDINFGSESFVIYSSIRYIPRALSESTLNTITS